MYKNEQNTKKAEEIAEELEWDLHECPGQESMGTNENLKAMLNYYIGEEDNYVVSGAVMRIVNVPVH